MAKALANLSAIILRSKERRKSHSEISEGFSPE